MLDIADHVAATFLDGAAVVPVSATTGEGLDDLRAALDDLVATTPQALDRARPRLWIDRVFAAKGSGTVVTGTLTGGSITRDHAVVVEPGGRPARVRSIQTLGSGIDRIGPGNRVALNLAGIAHDDVGRGDAVVTPGRWLPTQRFDATLEVLASLDHEVSRRGAYLAYIGSRRAPRQGARDRFGRARRPARPAPSASTCQSPCRCCPAIGTCCASRAATRPSGAARCSTSRRCDRRRRPRPTAPSSG